MQSDEIEDPNHNWLELEPSPFKELGLGPLNMVSLSVADSPFSKTDIAKYYPEVIVLDGQGSVIEVMGPNCQESGTYNSLKYRSGFRDDKLRINDDRKI